MLAASKDEERKALEKIQTIIDGLGAESYVATAFEGCYEIAIDNINNDLGCNQQQQIKLLQSKLDEATAKNAGLASENEELKKQVKQQDATIDMMRQRIFCDGDRDYIRSMLINQLSLIADAKTMATQEIIDCANNPKGIDLDALKDAIDTKERLNDESVKLKGIIDRLMLKDIEDLKQ